MPYDAFEHAVRAHLDRLQSALVAEHRLAIEHLEAKLAAREEERELLCEPVGPLDEQSGSSPSRAARRLKSPVPGSCCRGSARVAYGDAVLDGATASTLSDMGLPVLLPSSAPKAHDQLAAKPAKAADPPPSSHDSQRHPATIEELTRRESTTSKHHESDGFAVQGSGVSFRVLDIWDKPRMRVGSRKASLSSIERLSSSSTTTFSNCSHSDDDDLEDGGSTAPHWLGSRLQPLVVPPGSLRCLCWELLGLVLVAHDIVTIPLQVLDPPATALTDALSWLVRWFWTLDLAFSFLTGYVSPQGLVELRPARVARQYVRTRFCFDLALVSCDWVEALLAALQGDRSGEDATALRLLSMLRAIRLVRLLRLVKSQKISEFIFEHIRSEGVKLIAYILFVMLVLLCLIHVIACMWHGIHGAPDGVEDVLAQRYFHAFHTVLSLFVGEQLLEPGNLAERLFIIAVLIFAFVASAAFVGSLTTAMTQLQIIASKRSTQFASLNRFLSDYNISRQLANRVQQNARHALKEQKRHTPESKVELMALISDPLRSEIHYEVFAPILTAHPFFYMYNKVNSVGVRHICHTAICPVSLSRGDVLFSEFEVPVSPRMFFVVSGRLVYARAVEGQRSVGAKEWVAEAVLWTRWAHRGTLRALTESRLLSLDAARLSNIMSTFPTLHGVNYAERFVENLNQVAGCNELTDLNEYEEQTRQMTTSVFMELDRNIEVPWESRSRRNSSLSVSSLVSGKRLSFASRRSSVVSVVPNAMSVG